VITGREQLDRSGRRTAGCGWWGGTSPGGLWHPPARRWFRSRGNYFRYLIL